MKIQAIKTLLIKPGEMMLKGDNRHLFEKQLKDNIQSVLDEVCTYNITTESGRYYVYINKSDYTEQEIASMLCKVFGIVGIRCVQNRAGRTAVI